MAAGNPAVQWHLAATRNVAQKLGALVGVAWGQATLTEETKNKTTIINLFKIL